MTKTSTTIRTYNDLLTEKERLKALLQAQKQVLRQDVEDIKAELQPVKHAISVVGKFTTRDKSNPLLTSATESIIDLVVKRMLLARTGWLTKLVVPFLMKNVSSHLVNANQGKIFSKLFSFLGKKKTDDIDTDEFEQGEPVAPVRPRRSGKPEPEEPVEERAV
ncbi:MAG: hypothetical protein ABW007_19890 [Chitinophagaceae bacterium]